MSFDNTSNGKNMAKIIILNNKKCQIEIDDDKVLRRLYHHLSFKLLGVEYSAAYQNGWSRSYIFTLKN